MPTPLQDLLAGAIGRAGQLPAAGRTEVARRTGLPRTLVERIYRRPRLLPDDAERDLLALALNIPRQLVDDAAGAQPGGLRLIAGDRTDEMGAAPADRRADEDLAAELGWLRWAAAVMRTEIWQVADADQDLDIETVTRLVEHLERISAGENLPLGCYN